MTRKLEKLIKFVRFCDDLATLSTCKRAQCGAIIFDWGFRGVLGIGYNGQPAGTDNGACNGVEGVCGCVHAEANCLIKVPRGDGSRRDLAMYSTTYPCPHCAGLIANHGDVLCVFYAKPYRAQALSESILRNAGIHVARVMPSVTGTGTTITLQASLWTDELKKAVESLEDTLENL